MFIQVTYSGKDYLIPTSAIAFIEIPKQGFECLVTLKNKEASPNDERIFSATLKGNDIRALKGLKQL